MNKVVIIFFLFVLNHTLSYADEFEVGRRIYEEGLLSNGQPLIGIGANDTPLIGKEAACSNCHRRSGLGGVEGTVFMPPISANFIFNPQVHALAVTDPSQPMGITIKNHTYTDSALVNMIRSGVNYKGLTVTKAMPRYSLDDKSMNYTIDYLRHLSLITSAGVYDEELHFATVFTPEVDDKTKQVVKDEIEAFVLQHNSNMSTVQRHRRIGFDRLRQINRKWVFHFWELKGEPDTWSIQLDNFYKKNPVFALISGVSFQSADPVHDFCEENKTPCLLRSELYNSKPLGYYTMGFYSGMSLDAGLLISSLKKDIIKKPNRIIQIYSSSSVNVKINNNLGEQLKLLNIEDEVLSLESDNISSIRDKIESLDPNHLLLCWCDLNDIEKLGALNIPKESQVYFSGSLLLMKSGFKQFQDTWKNAKLLYPFELPDKRIRQLSPFYTWVSGHQFEPINEVIQSDTYTSMLVLQEAISEMVDNLYKDYLIERVENILGMGIEYWGIYSRPSFGTDQRYANRSGYITRFENNKFISDFERIVE